MSFIQFERFGGRIFRGCIEFVSSVVLVLVGFLFHWILSIKYSTNYIGCLIITRHHKDRLRRHSTRISPTSLPEKCVSLPGVLNQVINFTAGDYNKNTNRKYYVRKLDPGFLGCSLFSLGFPQ